MIAIIGGRRMNKLAGLEVTHRQVVRTPYGEPSGSLIFGTIGTQEIVFLSRHGHGITIPPTPLTIVPTSGPCTRCKSKRL